MRKFFLFVALLCTAQIAMGQSALSRSRPTPTPPPRVEVYAIANDGTQLQWTVYTPPGKGPWPAVLVIHGGLFRDGSFADPGVVPCAQDLANAGYVAFAINYRLAPPGSLPGQRSLGRSPDQYNDVHLAVQAARDDSRSNGQVGAVGGSAGGTHAVWVAATGTAGADRLDVGVSLSGAYDFSDFTPDPELALFIATVTNYVGVPSTNTAALRAASPAWVVNNTVSPLLLVQTVGDLMPAAQFADMVAQLNAHGVRNYTAMTISGALHSFEYWPQIKSTALAFLASGFAGRTH